MRKINKIAAGRYFGNLRIIAVFILIALALPLCRVPVGAAYTFGDLRASSALVAEVDTGEVLFGRNAELRHPADALTRVMTLLLVVTACENGEADPDDILVMTESAYYDIDPMTTTLGIMPEEKMSLRDLMYSAFVGGAGEACNLLAEHIAGSVNQFVRDMNTRASELGCSNTNFINTHGRYNDSQYTSALDQFVIFREALSSPLFVEISGIYTHEMEETNMSGARRVTSTNELLNQNSKYYYRSSTSGIASATFEGGYSVVAFAESGGLSLIAVVLGSDDIIFEDDSVELRNFTGAQHLFDWGLSQFSWRTILSSTDLIDRAPVMHGAGADFVNLRPDSSITLLLDNDIPDEAYLRTVIIYSVENEETLYAPIYAGDVLGEIILTRGNETHGPILLVANTGIELHRMQFVRMQINDMLETSLARTIIWVLILLVVGYIALVIRYHVIRSKRRRKIAQAKAKLREERQSKGE